MASLSLPPDYADWLASLKSRIGRAQQRVAVAVNQALVVLNQAERPRLLAIGSLT